MLGILYVFVIKCLCRLWVFSVVVRLDAMLVGPCPHGMARPQDADRLTASDKEGSFELIELAVSNSRRGVVL